MKYAVKFNDKEFQSNLCTVSINIDHEYVDMSQAVDEMEIIDNETGENVSKAIHPIKKFAMLQYFIEGNKKRGGLYVPK